MDCSQNTYQCFCDSNSFRFFYVLTLFFMGITTTSVKSLNTVYNCLVITTVYSKMAKAMCLTHEVVIMFLVAEDEKLTCIHENFSKCMVKYMWM